MFLSKGNLLLPTLDQHLMQVLVYLNLLISLLLLLPLSIGKYSLFYLLLKSDLNVLLQLYISSSLSQCLIYLLLSMLDAISMAIFTRIDIPVTVSSVYELVRMLSDVIDFVKVILQVLILCNYRFMQMAQPFYFDFHGNLRTFSMLLLSFCATILLPGLVSGLFYGECEAGRYSNLLKTTFFSLSLIMQSTVMGALYAFRCEIHFGIFDHKNRQQLRITLIPLSLLFLVETAVALFFAILGLRWNCHYVRGQSDTSNSRNRLHVHWLYQHAILRDREIYLIKQLFGHTVNLISLVILISFYSSFRERTKFLICQLSYSCWLHSTDFPLSWQQRIDQLESPYYYSISDSSSNDSGNCDNGSGSDGGNCNVEIDGAEDAGEVECNDVAMANIQDTEGDQESKIDDSWRHLLQMIDAEPLRECDFIDDSVRRSQSNNSVSVNAEGSISAWIANSYCL